jgi:hypothetical protein
MSVKQNASDVISALEEPLSCLGFKLEHDPKSSDPLVMAVSLHGLSAFNLAQVEDGRFRAMTMIGTLLRAPATLDELVTEIIRTCKVVEMARELQQSLTGKHRVIPQDLIEAVQFKVETKEGAPVLAIDAEVTGVTPRNAMFQIVPAVSVTAEFAPIGFASLVDGLSATVETLEISRTPTGNALAGLLGQLNAHHRT